MKQLRRLYNSIDALFDRAGLDEKVQFHRPAGPGNAAVTAGHAFHNCLPIATEFDRNACLMLIVAPDGSIQADGCSPRWEFLFDLPRRRAQMIAIWHFPGSEPSDDFPAARIEVSVTPFPPPDSIPRQLVRDGQLLRRQLIAMWHKERRRKPALPHKFRDSDAVMAEFAGSGLDVTQTEVTLRAECKASARPLWVADARRSSFRTRFT